MEHFGDTKLDPPGPFLVGLFGMVSFYFIRGWIIVLVGFGI